MLLGPQRPRGYPFLLPSLTVLWTVGGKCPANQILPCGLQKGMEKTGLGSAGPTEMATVPGLPGSEGSEDKTRNHAGMCWLVTSARGLLSLPALLMGHFRLSPFCAMGMGGPEPPRWGRVPEPRQVCSKGRSSPTAGHQLQRRVLAAALSSGHPTQLDSAPRFTQPFLLRYSPTHGLFSGACGL